MSYVSPLHIINHFKQEDEPGEELNLPRLQKMVLAEFNLQRSPVIRIGEKEYSKDDILKILEDLEQFTYPAHLAIYNVPLVLSFFEDPKTIPGKDVLLLFLEFNRSSPYYSLLTEQFTRSLYIHFKHYLSSHKYTALIPSLTLTETLTEGQGSLLSNLIAKHLSDLMAHIQEHVASKNLHFSYQLKLKDDLSFIFEEDFSGFLNSLSKEYEELITEVTNAIFYFMRYSYEYFAIAPEYLLEVGKAISRVKYMEHDTSYELSSFNNMLREKIRTLYIPSTPEVYITRRLDTFTGKKMMFRCWFIVILLFISSYFVTDYPVIRIILLSSGAILFLISFVLGMGEGHPD